jgi:leader peptidase (prepilin peptidase)/N-methyltransferase
VAREETTGETDLRPNLAVLLGGAAAIALVAGWSLPGPAALAATGLGVLMVAGADIDARTYLIPDLVSLGALAGGLLVAFVLAPADPWASLAAAAVRAAATALCVFLVRLGYGRLRGREGLGLGDVKLAGAVGAWLPLEAIPLCVGLAAAGALACAALARLRGEDVAATTRLPFGAFLCPALWLVAYAVMLSA